MEHSAKARGLGWRVLAVLGAIMVALFGAVSPASAHDYLTGTTPETGQTVKQAPDVVELRFSNNPLAMGSKVIVEGPDGKNWAAGDVEIVDNVASRKISPDAPAGKYKVTWRVVSSDSHPIEDTFSFTAKAGGSGGGGATDSSSGGSASESSESDAPSGSSDEASATASNTFPTGVVVGMGVVLVVVVAVIALIARRRLNQNGQE